MALVLISGFGIVVAVNFYMAGLAVNGFGGVVVKNSYVASQNFNGWLEQARQAEGLGWQASMKREEGGLLIVTTSDVPDGALLSAVLRRPLGDHQIIDLSFEETSPGIYHSRDALPSGRWIVRLSIEMGENRWAQEREI
jgi:nitrogen fixation protein FixH